MAMYKYVASDRVDVLRNGRIRFSQASALNDPIETSPVFDAITDLSDLLAPGEDREIRIEERVLNASGGHSMESHVFAPARSEAEMARFGAYIRGLQRRISMAFGESIGVLSLSETADNVLLWAHYAQQHEGFVIEFDEADQFFAAHDDGPLGSLLPVSYSINRPTRFSMTELTTQEMFLTKSKDWAYEREWRVLRLLSEADSQVTTPKGVVYLFSFPTSCISGLILGCRMAEHIKSELISLVAEDERYSRVGVLQATVDSRKYQLNFERLNVGSGS